jgi:DNA invertase Pin-like site-specific DNA recombinase
MARLERKPERALGRKPGQVRCAVYTRKSTEDGLEQDFNSLDAQREACEAYIRSQKSEGWVLVQDSYDDGGISGGTLERPALQRLMADIAGGRVDIVVVYKVDRLTRSLADFAKLVETFDATGASFVSVTQSFNTSTSMGRLTLNMLLSFAQFEREVTAERIRDKIAASKRKGMWMGGPVPLGYDAIDRKLVIDEAGARTVRHIYDRYLAYGTIRDLKADLDRDGVVSRLRVNKAGNQIGGQSLSRGALALILRNPLYIGEVQHKGERFAGQHEAIIDRDLWDRVQEQIDLQRVARRSASNAVAASPLAGMLFDQAGEPLTPSHASKGPARIRYRYYISNRLVTDLAADHPDAWRLPAEPVERAVRNTLVDLLRDGGHISSLLPDECSATENRQLLVRIDALAQEIENMDGLALRALLTDLAARIEIGPDSITLSISRAALLKHLGLDADVDEPDQSLICNRPLMLRKRGVETRLVLGDVIATEPDQAAIKLIADARSWMQRLRDGDVASIRSLARALDLDHRHVTRALPLAFLAPDIVRAILDGRQPVDVTVTRLKQLDPLPMRWIEQRLALGMPSAT